MKNQLSIYTLFTFILLTGLSLHTYAQNKLPKGEWIYQRSMGTMSIKMTAVFTKDQVVYAVATNGQEMKERSKTFKVLKSVVKNGKGKMLLQELDKEKYSIGFFNQKSKDELIMMPADPGMNDRSKAENMFKNAEKAIAEEMEHRVPGTPKQMKFDPYEFGWLWRSKKMVDELSALPTMPELDKKGLIEMMDDMIVAMKKTKGAKAEMVNAMAMMQNMETMLINKGYNPYTSMGALMKSQMKFASDPEVQKKAQELQKIQMSKKK
ncbi:hypothetical protein [Microscilla marina]|uniref:Uncharacterized protein n=1 Tax=Microscilla marina ATCC 23134 TaxID=313606 RepID=A1ZYI1_MICM2|nr:hypothetical protein [Microscilla marina]EAY24565.1 hypothetical protein M23134_06968 [Microscilla marina ATCC 23134]